jgi:hypothetical protein
MGVDKLTRTINLESLMLNGDRLSPLPPRRLRFQRVCVPSKTPADSNASGHSNSARPQ